MPTVIEKKERWGNRLRLLMRGLRSDRPREAWAVGRYREQRSRASKRTGGKLKNRTGRSVDNIICTAEVKTKLARLTYIFTPSKPVLTVERIQAKSQVLPLPASQVCPSPACFRGWAAGPSLQKALRTNTPSVKREIRVLFFD